MCRFISGTVYRWTSWRTGCVRTSRNRCRPMSRAAWRRRVSGCRRNTRWQRQAMPIWARRRRAPGRTRIDRGGAVDSVTSSGDGVWIAAGDQTDTAAEGQIGPEPVDHRGDAVAQADQKSHVYQSPEPPRRRAPELDAPKIGYRRFAADGRKA